MSDCMSEERRNEGSEHAEPWTTLDDANLVLHSFERGVGSVSDTSLVSLRVSLLSLLDDVNAELSGRDNLVPLEDGE